MSERDRLIRECEDAIEQARRQGRTCGEEADEACIAAAELMELARRANDRARDWRELNRLGYMDGEQQRRERAADDAEAATARENAIARETQAEDDDYHGRNNQ